MVMQANVKDQIMAERLIMARLNNPYLAKLFYAFQTAESLYLVMEFVNGGELFTHMNEKKRFKEDRAKQHAAEITEVLIFLHKQGIIYRDLKPENLLIDKQGHVRFIDMGLAKQRMKHDEVTFTFCGTPDYMAPEIIKKTGHSFPSDWYSLGCLIYEMISGFAPHHHVNRTKLMNKRLNEEVEFDPKQFSAEARDLLQKLLKFDPAERIG